uniref:START domain-containing protein n=1 Tax=Noccaea caerulescens TaxID=107243 RepID=A0A1J3HJP2_NOCCA
MNSGDSLSKLAQYFSSSEVFFRRADGDGVFCYCWATVFALVFLLLCQIFRKFRFFSHASSSSSPAVSVSPPLSSQSRISTLVSDEDLKGLIEKLEERNEDAEIWENIIQKSNPRVSYTAKSCKPKDGGPMKYLSTTVFEDCSAEVLRDFYMDNEYRTQWDKTVVEHEQLQVDNNNGIEIGRTIKKFPLLTPREYVLAWRLWEGKDKFYCFIKECDHSMVPQQRKYVRVSYFRSGWRVRKVSGRNACEIHMFHQEDAGLNVEMAKLAFSKGIWSYVCKMENALRKYVATSHRPQGPALSAVSLMKKIPSELETQTDDMTNSSGIITGGLQTGEGAKRKKLLRKPSKKLIANGLLLVGGAVCLSRGHSALGAKVALAYLLTKLRKRGAPLSQTSQEAGI